jgi:lipid II:glycine glycyltransferase (peptidoglycan interpeptide bridge formation enzyme)
MRPQVGRASASYDLRVTTQPADPDWDAFVARTPGGTYQQTSMWAETKSVLGWQPVRVGLRRHGELVGGFQLLLRRVLWAGAVAYLSRGPVVAGRDREACDVLLGILDDLAREQRVLYLKVQPPPDRHDMVASLRARGFVESSEEVAPTITVRVDVGRQPEALLAAMRANARTNIRKAERLGVRIREGSEADLPGFARLIEATSRRQGFRADPPSYYERMWRTFAAHGHARLLIAEHDGVVHSGNLLLAFGDSVVYKAGGWSGTRSTIRPNELLHWTGMQWARERGHRWYDFGGVELSVGRALLTGASPAEIDDGVTKFKLGFGGELAGFPPAQDSLYRPLRGALHLLTPQVDRLLAVARRLQGRKPPA